MHWKFLKSNFNLSSFTFPSIWSPRDKEQLTFFNYPNIFLLPPSSLVNPVILGLTGPEYCCLNLSCPLVTTVQNWRQSSTTKSNCAWKRKISIHVPIQSFIHPLHAHFVKAFKCQMLC